MTNTVGGVRRVHGHKVSITSMPNGRWVRWRAAWHASLRNQAVFALCMTPIAAASVAARILGGAAVGVAGGTLLLGGMLIGMAFMSELAKTPKLTDPDFQDVQLYAYYLKNRSLTPLWMLDAPDERLKRLARRCLSYYSGVRERNPGFFEIESNLLAILNTESADREAPISKLVEIASDREMARLYIRNNWKVRAPQERKAPNWQQEAAEGLEDVKEQARALGGLTPDILGQVNEAEAELGKLQKQWYYTWNPLRRAAIRRKSSELVREVEKSVIETLKPHDTDPDRALENMQSLLRGYQEVKLDPLVQLERLLEEN